MYWRTRNDVCFDKSYPRYASIIMGKVAHRIGLWAGLQKIHLPHMQVPGVADTDGAVGILQ